MHRDVDKCRRKQDVTAQKGLLQNIRQVEEILKMLEDPIMRIDSTVNAIHDGLDQTKRRDVMTWISRVEYESSHYAAQKKSC